MGHRRVNRLTIPSPVPRFSGRSKTIQVKSKFHRSKGLQMDNNSPKAGLSHWAPIAAAISIALVTFVLGQQPWLDSATLNDPKAAPRAVSPRGELWPDERSTIGLFRQASPAVVNITAIGVQRDLFTLNLYQIPQGTGSGFVWEQKATSSPIFTLFRMPLQPR